MLYIFFSKIELSDRLLINAANFLLGRRGYSGNFQQSDKNFLTSANKFLTIIYNKVSIGMSRKLCC